MEPRQLNPIFCIRHGISTTFETNSARQLILARQKTLARQGLPCLCNKSGSSTARFQTSCLCRVEYNSNSKMGGQLRIGIIFDTAVARRLKPCRTTSTLPEWQLSAAHLALNAHARNESASKESKRQTNESINKYGDFNYTCTSIQA